MKGRPPSPARAIPCEAHSAPAGTPCALRQRKDAQPTPWYCAARLMVAGLTPAKGGKAPSGHQRGHPERKKCASPTAD